MGFDMEMEDFHENEEFKKKLKEMMEEMTKEAKNVRGDYKKNPSPSEMSGSVHHVHQNSPILKTGKERLISFKSNKNVDKKK
tara:strand:+ start:844 stop:1089 length:246 start_codon:yes stop_codon:yes gene_type:complete